MLRLLTYLAPSIPAGVFEVLATYLSEELRRDVELTFDASRSGPRPGEPEPFSSGEIDLAFLCATSYVWLTGGETAVVELVGTAWAPLDPRSKGRPIYFGDVLAKTGGPASLQDLAGRRVTYNDDVSLSGYHSLRLALARAGVPLDSVEWVRSGSHLRSLELLLAGSVDAAAVDSNVWRRRRRESPGLAESLTPLGGLGPHPVQPLVARAGLSKRVREAVRDALLRSHAEPAVAAALRSAEFGRFERIGRTDYEPLRRRLAVVH